MPVFWTPELNTGIRIIDLQHQELVELLNELEELADSETPPATINSIVLRLQQYVLFHFAHEEGLMQRQHVHSGHLSAHLAEHAGFASAIEKAVKALTTDTPPVIAELHAFLQDWLVRHIMGTDKTLAGLMRKGTLQAFPQ